MRYERNKREDRLAYLVLSHFICHAYGTRCKHKYERTECVPSWSRFE